MGDAGTEGVCPASSTRHTCSRRMAAMMRPSRSLPLGLLLCAPIGSAQQTALPTIELKPGLVITQSARVDARVYELPPTPPAGSAIIVVRWGNITLDFSGATVGG